jgi:hypothetical protein
MSTRTRLVEVLDDVEEFLDNHQDVVDGPYGEPHANRAMQLLAALREERCATSMINERLLDALRGMVGLVQLVARQRYPDFPVDNHRMLEAMSAIAEAERPCP